MIMLDSCRDLYDASGQPDSSKGNLIEESYNLILVEMDLIQVGSNLTYVRSSQIQVVSYVILVWPYSKWEVLDLIRVFILDIIQVGVT